MYRFQRIDEKNTDLVESFLSRLGNGATSFRYFDKRPIEVVLKHILTVVTLDHRDVPLAYGHLDREGNDLWLGIAVAEQEQGLGLGKQMLKFLTDEAKSNAEDIVTLTVDKSNSIAIRLYETHGFILSEERDNYYKYTLLL